MELSNVITIDPELHSGTPCIAGTRVPVQDLFDYLGGGDSLDVFLESFPSVPREKAIQILELASRRVIEGCPSE